MTQTMTSAADRAAQLATRRDEIEARRASLLADLDDLEQAQHDTARDAYAARPDVERQRATLAGQVGTLTRERRAAVLAGEDTADVTRRLVETRILLELADADAAEVKAMAATVEAELVHERRVAEFERVVAQLAEVDAAAAGGPAAIHAQLAQAIAEVRALADRLISTVAEAKQAAGRATALRHHAGQLAAEVGRSLSPAPMADPVQAVSEAIGGDFPQRRLLNSAARGHRDQVLVALAENGRWPVDDQTIRAMVADEVARALADLHARVERLERVAADLAHPLVLDAAVVVEDELVALVRTADLKNGG